MGAKSFLINAARNTNGIMLNKLCTKLVPDWIGSENVQFDFATFTCLYSKNNNPITHSTSTQSQVKMKRCYNKITLIWQKD